MKNIFASFNLFLFLFTANTYAQDSKTDFIKDSIRILYTGYDNIVVIPKGTLLSNTDATIAVTLSKFNEITYKVIVPSTAVNKIVKLSITQNKKVITRTFKVENLPYPVVYIGGINTYTEKAVKKAAFIGQAPNGIRINYPPEAAVKVKFTIQRFHLTVKVAGLALIDETIEGSTFNKKALNMFKSTAKYTVIVTEIFGMGPAGPIKASGFTLEVAE